MSNKQFTQEQINLARQVPLLTLLEHLEAYVKHDKEYKPSNLSAGSIRVDVNYLGRNYRFIITGEKWINDLLSRDVPKRGGGGAIDFYQHINPSANFMQAVAVCLAATMKHIAQ